MRTTLSLARLSVAIFLALSLLTTTANADDALRDFDGNITSLDAYKESGKWTVVMIWASDCHVCNQEAGSYSDFHTAHADKDAKIIGLSLDGQSGKADAEAFIERNGVIYPNLIGDVRAVATWYRNQTGDSFRATPTFVVYDQNGVLQAAQPGAVPPHIIEEFMASNS